MTNDYCKTMGSRKAGLLILAFALGVLGHTLWRVANNKFDLVLDPLLIASSQALMYLHGRASEKGEPVGQPLDQSLAE